MYLHLHGTFLRRSSWGLRSYNFHALSLVFKGVHPSESHSLKFGLSLGSRAQAGAEVLVVPVFMYRSWSLGLSSNHSLEAEDSEWRFFSYLFFCYGHR
jgi:hypothetical protein